MTITRGLLVVVMLLLLPAVMGNGCGKGANPNDPNEQDSTLIVDLHNRSSSNTHLMGPGEDFSPSNRVAPGGERTLTFPIVTGERVAFSAGRDGVVLGRVTCTWTCNAKSDACGWHGEPGLEQPDAFDAEVEWNGSTLVCADGWRRRP